ncbi:MAG: hypothetical protein K0U70_12900, partial [Actinomycetia bacterium]|nr:hypothetical protein [Actinomycetes bacterium]MCH9768686.1 hypothetical protein [Actinomycetes bacterium]
KSETNKKHQNWHFPKNSHTPKREKEAQPKKQQTKTTKHTIEFSNNTPARPRDQPAAQSRELVVRTVRKPPKWSFPLGRRRAQRAEPASRRRQQVT